MLRTDSGRPPGLTRSHGINRQPLSCETSAQTQPYAPAPTQFETSAAHGDDEHYAADGKAIIAAFGQSQHESKTSPQIPANAADGDAALAILPGDDPFLAADDGAQNKPDAANPAPSAAVDEEDEAIITTFFRALGMPCLSSNKKPQSASLAVEGLPHFAAIDDDSKPASLAPLPTADNGDDQAPITVADNDIIRQFLQALEEPSMSLNIAPQGAVSNGGKFPAVADTGDLNPTAGEAGDSNPTAKEDVHLADAEDEIPAKLDAADGDNTTPLADVANVPFKHDEQASIDDVGHNPIAADDEAPRLAADRDWQSPMPTSSNAEETFSQHVHNEAIIINDFLTLCADANQMITAVGSEAEGQAPYAIKEVHAADYLLDV